MPVLDIEVTAEISDDGKRVMVTFPYHQAAVRAVKTVPGARFLPPNQPGGPAWKLPLDLTSMRLLREAFGTSLSLGPKLKEWGKEAVAKEQAVMSMADAEDAVLEQVKKLNPEFHEWLRPDQRADAAFMAAHPVICANQPGLGKTAATIASIMERCGEGGSHLIVAPKTSLDAVWAKELEDKTDIPFLTMSGDDSKETRQEILECCKEFREEGTGFFLVLNPAFILLERDKSGEMIIKQGKRVWPMIPKYPELYDFEWDTIVFDEYHKMGLSNNKTNMFEAANSLRAKHKLLLSGTPMGGKPIKLWGALHFLDPGSFTSKWRWADQWLEVEDNGFGKVIHGIQKGKKDNFWFALKPYMVRRTKEEILKDLPPKQHVDIWCDMTPQQAKQYKIFAENAEIKIEEENLSATGILAEYTRLKQFASAHQSVANVNGDLKVTPTANSGKLPHLLALLEERGITGDDDAEGDEQVVIGSQFSQIVDMVTKYLQEKGIAAEKITGAVSQARRTELVEEFQRGDVRVMVVTTTAAGVALTLDKASTVIVMDETWNPDDQEQLEDRVHRASRIHQVTCYYLRSKGTIEEYINKINIGKAVTNREILDLRRAGLRAI